MNKHAWERIHALQKEVDRLLNERIENLELVNDRQRYRYAVKALSDYCRSRTLVSAKKIGLIIDEYLEEDDLYAET